MTSPTASSAESPYAQWTNGPPTDPGFLPILVWSQDPALAQQYKAIGVNTYFALHRGPTPEQLDRLRDAGMHAICRQNDVALADIERGDSPIIAWMHGDEPDNRRGPNDPHAGQPVPPEKIQRDAEAIRAKDPTRPIVVNFGQGVANDAFPGRGATLEQYPLYARGADIVCYDVYPVANLKLPGPDGRTIFAPDGHEYLWYVAKGVQRLRSFVEDRKPVWNVLECTHIHNPERIATPHQVRAEAWMSLIHGSRGLCWFVHDFREGHKNDAALLANDEMREAVTRVNGEIRELAPVLNAPAGPAARVLSSDANAPVAATTRSHDGWLYIFAVAMRNAACRARFTIEGASSADEIEVLGGNRALAVEDGSFADDFQPYDVRLYRVAQRE